MPLLNTRSKFGSMVKFLHWGIFILIVSQYSLITIREYFATSDAQKMDIILLHKSLGLVVLIFALLMLLGRHLGKRPVWPPMQGWERKLAAFVHIGLYLCLLVMPLSGTLMSQFHGYSVKFFGYPIPTLVSPHESLEGFFHAIHGYTAWILFALVTLHIGAALFHHFIRKDNVLKRMLPLS